MQLKLDDIGGAKELALYRVGVAKEDLEAAEISFESGHYRSSNNRAYYAIFRAISACLALEFKAYKQHAQVMGNFNKDFVHTGIFPKEISRKICRAQEVRHASDYDDFYIVSVEDAKEQLETAREVINMVENIWSQLSELTPRFLKSRTVRCERGREKRILPKIYDFQKI